MFIPCAVINCVQHVWICFDFCKNNYLSISVLIFKIYIFSIAVLLGSNIFEEIVLNFFRKKKLVSKDQREKQRQQMIAARRATLKFMGTPRSMVLAQLVQEEATKQAAEILLPKNVSLSFFLKLFICMSMYLEMVLCICWYLWELSFQHRREGNSGTKINA